MLNKNISTTVAILIIVVITALAGGIFCWQFSGMGILNNVRVFGALFGLFILPAILTFYGIIRIRKKPAVSAFCFLSSGVIFYFDSFFNLGGVNLILTVIGAILIIVGVITLLRNKEKLFNYIRRFISKLTF